MAKRLGELTAAGLVLRIFGCLGLLTLGVVVLALLILALGR